MASVSARFARVCAGILLVGAMANTSLADTIVEFQFSISGVIYPLEVQLYDTAAPITVANFLKYVNAKAYDGTIIHRDVHDFSFENNNPTGNLIGSVIQGGGFMPVLDSTHSYYKSLNLIATYPPIQNEFSPTRSNTNGTIAMAKVGGDPNSATSQWFFNLGNNSANLDNQNGGFTVFGQVLGDGMTLLNAINDPTKCPTKNINADYGYASDTANGPFNQVPLYKNTFITVQSISTVSPTSEIVAPEPGSLVLLVVGGLVLLVRRRCARA